MHRDEPGRAQLYRSYRQKINTLKSMKAAELQHEIGALPPCHRFTYANRIQAQAQLMLRYKIIYEENIEEAVDDAGEPVELQFEIKKSWLNKDLLNYMFPDDGEATSAAPAA